MGLLSASASITRYRVEGELGDPVMETVVEALNKHRIQDIDDEPTEKAVGWTSFESPFRPEFDRVALGTHFVFSLRLDKKTIPAKMLKKQCEVEMSRVLAETKREFLARSEKSRIRETVMERLYLKIPSTPNVYDIVWNYESADLWFYSNLKAANEELETLFSKTFKMTLIRLFPFTMADLTCGLTDADRDEIARLTPARFAG